jgi:hypothetical protein
MRRAHSRARAVAAATVGMGLCLTATVAMSAPSQAASGTCDVAYPVASLTSGQAVTGLTVSSGTTPTAFTGTVLGVLKDGIEPGVDMVMMRLTSPEIDRVGGIWEGMSGSPVYSSDGRLIGAVAYGLAFGTTPVAGITPYEDMQQYAGTTAPTKIPVGRSMADAIAKSTGVTARQASQGMSQLREPIGVFGIGSQRLAKLTGRPYLSKDTYAAGTTGGSSAVPTVADIVAGGNLAATLSTGDITQGGVGTVTSVCNNIAIGFGHPLAFAGRTTYGLAGADAIYVQEDPLGVPFKVANIGALLGTVSQDRMTGIAGALGVLPPETPITSTISYGTRTRTGTSDVQVQSALPSTVSYEQDANHSAVLDAYQKGSEQQSWTITGHTSSGPFTLTGGNRYADPFDISFASLFDVPDLTYLLTSVPGVTVDSVSITSHVIDNDAVLTISGAKQFRNGHWATVDKTHPAVVKAGKLLKMKLLLTTTGGGASTERFAMRIPKSAAGSHGRLETSSTPGFAFEPPTPPTSLQGVRALVRNAQRNDQVSLDLSLNTLKGTPKVLHDLTGLLPKVVVGQKGFKVKVQ